MTKKTRRNHGSAFKAKVALETLKEESTVAEIAAKYNVHPTLVNQWKRALLDGASGVFDTGTTKEEKQSEATTNELFKQIGQMKVEIDFLSRKLGR